MSYHTAPGFRGGLSVAAAVERAGSGRVGIVALARRFLVALWRSLDQGVIPQGAILKA
jgi:hypothetical protein